jgi:hypothetical protein
MRPLGRTFAIAAFLCAIAGGVLLLAGPAPAGPLVQNLEKSATLVRLEQLR